VITGVQRKEKGSRKNCRRRETKERMAKLLNPPSQGGVT